MNSGFSRRFASESPDYTKTNDILSRSRWGSSQNLNWRGSSDNGQENRDWILCRRLSWVVLIYAQSSRLGLFDISRPPLFTNIFSTTGPKLSLLNRWYKFGGLIMSNKKLKDRQSSHSRPAIISFLSDYLVGSRFLWGLKRGKEI